MTGGIRAQLRMAAGGRLPVVLIVLLGTFLAWGGVVDGADSIIYYVFGIVDKVPNDPLSILKPIFNPEPMYTYAYRPLSTAILKLGGLAFGRDIESLKLFTFLHGLVLILFGLGARRFLLAHGLSPRVSLASALLVMGSSTVLWSAWTLPEYDMVGGAFVMFAGAALRSGKIRQFVPLALLAMVTKETTAALMFAYLLAYAALHFKEDRRPMYLAGMYFLCLLAAVSPTLVVKAPVSHEFYVRSEFFELGRVLWLAMHNISQVLYSFGPAGALLLWHAARPQRSRGPLLVLSLALLFLPMARQYNHYEAIVFSDPLWVVCSGLLLVVGLLLLLWRGDRDQRLLALTIVLGFLGLLAGPVLASAARSDLSARLYAPLLPILFGLALHGAEYSLTARPQPWSRWTKPVCALLALSLAWQSAAGGVSQWQFWQARFPTELAVKQEMIKRLQGPCPRVYYPNHNQELAIEELDALGDVPEEVRRCVSLVQLLETDTRERSSAWNKWIVAVDGLRGVDQFRNRVDSSDVTDALMNEEVMPRGMQLFVQTPRSTMGAEINSRIKPDFTWAETRIPEARLGTFEQAIGIMFVETTMLEEFIKERAHYSLSEARDFFVVPLWLHEIPQRLISGLPVIERYRYEALLFGFEPGRKVESPTE